MTPSLSAAVLVALLVPEILAQSRLTPSVGAAIWFAALAFRALVAVIVAVALLSYLPATELFAVVTGWCLDGIAPLLSSHRGVSGHGLGETALLLPSAVLLLSLLWALAALGRGVLAVARWMRRSAVGTGPRDSLIVGGPDLLVAAAGFRTPKVVVSAGALAELDEAELEASLEHERGHIVRRHRYILMVATLLLAAARFVPGSRRAFERLRFQLERDADAFVLRHGGDSLALASAISKAALSARAAPMPLTRLAGADTASRLRLLLHPQRGASALARWSTGALAVALLTGVMVASMALPGLASAGIAQIHKPATIVECR